MAEAVIPVTGSGTYGRRFAALFGAGLVGIVALAPSLTVALDELLEGKPHAPLPALVALSLAQPALLLAVAVAAGTALAPRLGLVSRIAAWASGDREATRMSQREVAVALLTGLVVAVVLLLLDMATRPALGPAAAELSLTRGRTAWLTLAGLFYGGITEELMLRWGLLTVLAYAGWRLLARGRGRPGVGVMWAAAVLAALVFGAAHLPAVAAAVPLTPPVIARTVVMNALGGIAFGWLFWKRSLEAAMLAHAAVHVVLAAAAVSGV